MSEHRVIRCDAAPLGAREEVMPDFEGRGELERAILEARDRGEADALADLRRQYRQRAHGITRSPGATLPFITTPPARSDIGHSLGGYALTWDAVDHVRTVDGKPAMFRFGRRSFDRWLASVRLDAAALPVIWQHGRTDVTSVFGNVASAVPDEVGLRVLCQLDDTPAAHEVLLAADEGRLGFSVHAEVRWSDHIGEAAGLPLYQMTEGTLREVSLLLRADAADPAAVVLDVGGESARYRKVAEAQARDAILRKSYGFVRSGPPWGIPPWRR